MVALFSKDFVRLVVIANLIALPVVQNRFDESGEIVEVGIETPNNL